MSNTLITENRKARFEYHLEDKLEVGIILQGWEIKAIRENKVQMAGGYVIIKDGELFLIGLRIDPLVSVSTHTKPEPERTRKLLAHRSEINKLIGKTEQKGYTLVPTDLHFTNGRVKMTIALAKGKNVADKRETTKERDWKKEQGRLMKSNKV